jgi:hypothetical protein
MLTAGIEACCSGVIAGGGAAKASVMSIGVNATTSRLCMGSLLPRRAALIVFVFLSAATMGSGSPRPQEETAERSLQPADRSEQNPTGNAHSYLDEPSEKLVKHFPELKGIRPAADQQALPVILSRTGEEVDEFFNNVVDLVANEEIKQERLGSFGAARASHPVRDSYLILHQKNGERADFDEFRMDEKGNRIDEAGLARGFLVTSGFALICAHFSREFQWDSKFRYLGDQKINGRDAYVVAFAQLPGEASLTVTMKGPNGTAVQMLTQGLAWVDKGNFHILRMRTDLLARQAEIGLDEQTTKVNFGEVRLVDVATPLWLPRDVTVYVKLGAAGDRHLEEAFRNVHHYTNYRRYRVSTKIMAPK